GCAEWVFQSVVRLSLMHATQWPALFSSSAGRTCVQAASLSGCRQWGWYGQPGDNATALGRSSTTTTRSRRAVGSGRNTADMSARVYGMRGRAYTAVVGPISTI